MSSTGVTEERVTFFRKVYRAPEGLWLLFWMT